MVTDDGWCVEAIGLDGTTCYRVTLHGFLVPPPQVVPERRRISKQLMTTVDDVQLVMGDAFLRLRLVQG